MVELTQEELFWVKEHFPELKYDSGKLQLFGNVKFSLRFDKLPVIKDNYHVMIDFSQMHNRSDLPIVYNTDNRIIKAAKRKHKPCEDFHISKDGKLCMILSCKVRLFYPNGFNLQDFMSHLCNHLYWVSYFELYDKEPWPGEKHGNEAYIEYLSDYNNITFIVNNKHQLELYRKLFRKKYGRGIALNKLKNRLLTEPTLFQQLINI